MSVTIAPLAHEHRQAWDRLFADYAEFYGVPDPDPEITWSWLMDAAHPVKGLVAVDPSGAVIGFAHYFPFPSSLRGREIGFVNDLFVDPNHRGGGVGERLLRAAASISQNRGWVKTRWVTQESNATARRLYDRVAILTDWRMYDMLPENGSGR